MSIRSAFAVVAGAVLALISGITGLGQSGPELKVGDVAPAFTLRGSDGKTYRLSDYAGKTTVVLAWFPKAFTGG